VPVALVKVVPLVENWTVKAVAYAASQFSFTLLTAVAAPRSTCSHWAAAKALDQRVPVLPSVAADAGVPSHSTDEAVVGLPWERTTSAASASRIVATR
jgi:hypothetical protein